jgi:LPS-assembly lipoprotein
LVAGGWFAAGGFKLGFDSQAIRRLVHAATVLAAGLLVAGCFQPLYGDRSVSGGPKLREALSGVQVMEIRAPADTPEARMAVPIQNELRFAFTGGSGAGTPTHRLVLQIAGNRTVVSATNVSGLPVLENFTLNATYSLVEIATNKPVLTGRATTTVSYDPSGTQRYARVTGMQDAERRAAKVISDNVTTRLSSYFFSGS